MKFGGGSKWKSKAPSSQAAPPPTGGSSPASSTSSFISVGRLMEQRERLERSVRFESDSHRMVKELDDLDDALDAMSLVEANHVPDELFDAFTGYMEVIKASVTKKATNPKVAVGVKGRVKPPTLAAAQNNHHNSNPYIRSMQDVIDKKRGGMIGSEKKTRAGEKIIKATGETRRLMEEIAVAKENVHLFNRLVAVSPSTNVNRRTLLNAFSKSREYLEKMSRFAAVEHGKRFQRERGARPAWDDNWVGCMV